MFSSIGKNPEANNLNYSNATVDATESSEKSMHNIALIEDVSVDDNFNYSIETVGTTSSKRNEPPNADMNDNGENIFLKLILEVNWYQCVHD